MPVVRVLGELVVVERWMEQDERWMEPDEGWMEPDERWK